MNARSTTRSGQRWVLVGVSTATLAVAGLAFGVQAAAAAKAEHKVTICHATSSAKNPFTVNSVDVSSIANLTRGNGHGTHTDDIIPPFTDLKGTSYPGQNWSPAAQDYVNAGCNGPFDDGGGNGGGDGDT